MRKDSKDSKSFLKNEDGVSPVIGVILMVAITVILAAVVAGFVFGAIDMPGATPTASISVDSATEDEIVLVHDGGDSLMYSDTSIVVTDDDNSQSVVMDDELNNEEDRWSVGQRITLNATDNGDSDEVMEFDDIGGSFSGDVEIRIVDDPSGGTISVRTVTIN